MHNKDRFDATGIIERNFGVLQHKEHDHDFWAPNWLQASMCWAEVKKIWCSNHQLKTEFVLNLQITNLKM